MKSIEMFRKLHYKLTALCALITMGILILFSVLYLTISEHTLRENDRLSFQHDFDSIVSSLEQQKTITYDYLLRLEQNNGYQIFLWDNGQPLAFNLLKSHLPYGEYAEAAKENYFSGRTASGKGNGIFDTYELASGETGCVGLCQIFPGQSMLERTYEGNDKARGLLLLVFASDTALSEQLRKQRLLFLMLCLLTELILILFASLFTKKLLKPLAENQKKQLLFVANASHELRTPLAVILSSLAVKPPCYEKTIRQEAERMSHLVEDMLFLTGLENGKRPVSLTPLAPDTLLLDFYEQTESLVRESGHFYHLQLPEEMVADFSCDRDKITQLLLNLLQNAISYTPKGWQITLALCLKKGEICFQVIDNGMGIAPEKRKEIFERFYREDGSRHEKEHYGLGLCIAKEIVLSHKGKIYVTETPGGGSTFSCCFPVSISSAFNAVK